MSAQHTPGPWHVSAPARSDAALDYAIYISDADGRREIIAEAFGRSDWEHPHPSDANARLIAAAPDLLDMARKALAAWTGEGPPIGLDSLRAVIAKATGSAA